MRTLPPAVAAHLAARKAMLVHALVWITARDRDTGAPESIGLWTGADHQTITVGGVARPYYGVGALIGLDDLVTNAQMEVRTWNMQFSPLHAQVIEAIRVYDARLAPVELHLWYHDALTDLPLADPVREFRGTVMEVQITTPPGEGEASCTVTCVSDAWRLTRGLTVKRSDAALRNLHPGDGFRRWNTISGAVETAWGERIKPAAGETAPVPPLRPKRDDK